MQGTLLDDLGVFIRARMEAAARDKALYDRNGARLNSQLLQGELNMGTAVLAWLEGRRAGRNAAGSGAEASDDGGDVGEQREQE